MRTLIFHVLGALFRLCRVFPVNPYKVVLLRNFPVWGALEAMEQALRADDRFRVIKIADWRRPGTLYHMATAGTIFLNNNFNLLPHLHFSKQTRLVQLWHGDGAWKRWGCSVAPDVPKIHYDYAICNNDHVRPFWAEAFGMPLARTLPLGSPRLDALTQPYDKAAARAAFDRQYPACKGKRLFLYAPTFRDDPDENLALLSHFDFAAFNARFGGTAALLVRLHPKLHGQYDLRGTGAIDMTGAPDPAQLLRVCDLFLTDYSSLCFDAAALDLPVVLYAFDEARYMTQERGFYKPLRELPPGPIANTFPALLDLLAAPDHFQAQRAAFAGFHLGAIDGKSCERIIRFLWNA